MEGPSTLLTLFAAILGTSTASALSKLTGVFLPLAALVVGALSDAAPRVVLPAEVPHNNSGPVLHVRAVVSHCKLFHQGENVEIVWEEELLLILLLFLFHLCLQSCWINPVEQLHFLSNLETRNQVALLKVFAQVAVFGDVGQKLKRHEHIFLPRHGGDHLGIRRHLPVEEITGHACGGQLRLLGSDHGWSIGRQADRYGSGSCGVDDATINSATVRDVEGSRLLCLGNRGRGHINASTGNDGIVVFHRYVLDPNRWSHVVGAGHICIGSLVGLHATFDVHVFQLC